MVEGEISFGRFRLDLARRELRRDQSPVRLGSRALDILCVLASAGGEVVSKDELMERVWAGVVVEEHNIEVHISALRRALAEDGDRESRIVTVPGRGYRLLGAPKPPAVDNPAAEPSVPVADEPSLAVLPFLNLSGDPEQEYFADGMVEEITTALSRIRWLSVTARNSSFTYKGQHVDVKRVGSELGVRYVLEGSVRKSSNRVRITCQLIDAGTGAHLWADHFDGSLEDLFELQDRVASSAAGAIEPTLEAAEIRRSDQRPTQDLTSYDLYLRALKHHRSYEKDRLLEALDLLGRAIERDPVYGRALVLAAYCHAQLDLNDWMDDREANRCLGLDLTRRALRVGADDPDVLAPAAYLLGHFGEDIHAAIGLMDRALASRPSFAHGWFWSGWLRLFAGQPDLSIEHFERGRRLSPRDPLEPRSLTGIAFAHFFNRRFDEAARLLLRSLQELPNRATAHHFLAACYAHLGRLDEAHAIVARLSRNTDQMSTGARRLRDAEHRELLLSGLRLATGEEDGAATPPPRVDVPRRPSSSHPREAERRQITALSCELVGVAPGTGGMDPEDLREAVGEFQRCVSQAAERHQGFVYRDLRDSALVLFGYPDAHEHDAEQAVRASVELCAAVRTLRGDADLPVRCRVGVATGTVIIGDPVGVEATRGEGMVGDAPNLAVRLSLSAQADTVTIDPATRRLIGNLFDCRELGISESPGGAALLRAWQVLGESIVASRFEALRGSTLSPLVGRDEEIELLLRRWARAKAGDGQIVLVSGEPGIGKSRLTAALAQRIESEPHTRLRYFCSPYHQDSALFPFADQLARAAGFSRDDNPATKLEKLMAVLARAASPNEDVALLADLLSLPVAERRPLPSLSPHQKKDRTSAALIRQLEGLGRRQPVVVVFEDAHWIDPTSRELLDLTVERVRSLPVLLIVTFRPEFEPSWTGQEQVSTLALNRLDRRDRRVLVEQIAGGKRLPDEVVARIIERTDGVPLFVEELTKSILESGLLREEADRYVLDRALPPLAIPTTLRASLRARLDRLASVQHVAQIGAAIGREFAYALLRAVCRLPDDELQTSLSRLVASELVSQRGTLPDSVYSFKHALVQDAAHDSLLRNARQQLHAEVAEALEAHFPEIKENQPELLAQHYAEAGLIEKSVTCWGKAGHRSAARSAMAEAAAQYQKGLDQLALLSDNPDRQREELELRSSLGAALLVVKGYGAPEAGQAYVRARELWEQLGCPSEFLRVPYGQSLYHMNRGEFDVAQSLAEDLLRLSRQRNDTAGLILGHYSSARSLGFTGNLAQWQSHLEAALALYDPMCHQSLIEDAGFHPYIGTRANLAIVLLLRGFPDQALAQSQAAVAEARTLAHSPTLGVILHYRTTVLSLIGEGPSLDEAADELVAIATEQSFPFWGALGTICRGWVKAKEAHVIEGVSLLRHGLSAFRATGAQAWIPYLIALLAQACKIAGQFEEGSTLLDDAMQIAEGTGERWFVAELCRHKGQLLLLQGRTEAAGELYHRALAIAREQEAKLWELRAAVSLARLRCDQGRPAEARDLLAPVYGWFTEGFDTADLKEAKALLDALDV
jgi:TolB-like protein/class 3 adenylate cyclase/predicted ATPase